MHRVKAKVEAENDKKQTMASQKRTATDDNSPVSRPQQRRLFSQQRGGSGAAILPPSPTAISPLTSTNHSLPLLAGNPTVSPTSSFTPVGVNGTRSFTPQSQNESSPGGSELVYPFALGGQGIYTPFGNSPPFFPVAGQEHIPTEIMDITKREDDGSGQLWQSIFGPPGSSLPPPQYSQGFAQPFATAQGEGNISLDGATGEFKDPNDVNIDWGGDPSSMGVDLDDGLVDWGDFIAQCSQVWVTE